MILERGTARGGQRRPTSKIHIGLVSRTSQTYSYRSLFWGMNVG